MIENLVIEIHSIFKVARWVIDRRSFDGTASPKAFRHIADAAFVLRRHIDDLSEEGEEGKLKRMCKRETDNILKQALSVLWTICSQEASEAILGTTEATAALIAKIVQRLSKRQILILIDHAWKLGPVRPD